MSYSFLFVLVEDQPCWNHCILVSFFMVEDQPFHMVFVGIIVYWYLFMVEDQPFHMVFVGIIVIGNFLWWKTNLLT